MKTPYWFQTEAVQALYDHLAAPGCNPLIGLPTGTGKSFVIATFIEWTIRQWPDTRILCLTHVKELISQNYNELIELWPTAPAGICSAGLGSYDTNLSVVFGGVQTVVNRVESLGYRDLLIIDEAHLLSPKDETRYQLVIAELKKTNPNLRIIGLSATMWRLGQGHLIEGGLFTDVAYDMTSWINFNRLVEEGFISPLVTPTRNADGSRLTQYDLSNVHINGWQLNERELDAATNQEKLNYKICQEQIALAEGRKSCLVFCSSIAHSEAVAGTLRKLGETTVCVHSKKSDEDNAAALAAWTSGQIRWMVNKDKLTTGFNHRPVDFIGWMRPLVSSSLWVQGNGRGTRTSPDKINCLVADFCGNTERLGPINDPVIPRKPGKGNAGSIPIKVCPQCECFLHSAVRKCDNCGHIFEVVSKMDIVAGMSEIIRTADPVYQTFQVSHITYSLHEKSGRPSSVRCDYKCGHRTFSHWLLPEHGAWGRKKLTVWWKERFAGDLPETSAQTLEILNSPKERKTEKSICVIMNRKYPEIVKFELTNS